LRGRINFLKLRVAATEKVEEVLGGSSSSSNDEPSQVVHLTDFTAGTDTDTAAPVTGAVSTRRIRKEELYYQQQHVL